MHNKRCKILEKRSNMYIMYLNYFYQLIAKVKVGVQSVLRFKWAWSKIKFALVRLLGSFQEASY